MRIIKFITFMLFILLAGSYLPASAQFGQPETKKEKEEFKKKIYSLVLPDLENFLNFPPMRKIFETAERLYQRLTEES